MFYIKCLDDSNFSDCSPEHVWIFSLIFIRVLSLSEVSVTFPFFFLIFFGGMNRSTCWRHFPCSLRSLKLSQSHKWVERVSSSKQHPPSPPHPPEAVRGPSAELQRTSVNTKCAASFPVGKQNKKKIKYKKNFNSCHFLKKFSVTNFSWTVHEHSTNTPFKQHYNIPEDKKKTPFLLGECLVVSKWSFEVTSMIKALSGGGFGLTECSSRIVKGWKDDPVEDRLQLVLTFMRTSPQGAFLYVWSALHCPWPEYCPCVCRV